MDFGQLPETLLLPLNVQLEVSVLAEQLLHAQQGSIVLKDLLLKQRLVLGLSRLNPASNTTSLAQQATSALLPQQQP